MKLNVKHFMGSKKVDIEKLQHKRSREAASVSPTPFISLNFKVSIAQAVSSTIEYMVLGEEFADILTGEEQDQRSYSKLLFLLAHKIARDQYSRRPELFARESFGVKEEMSTTADLTQKSGC
ncbi:hypothetical protein H4Q26_011265 [Puccinia striiformis f. sp. tritici PST-130]|nr:hypothetical protein H4Q26_011265 [Puccinia striiformis f. sp. tritici PST-130]